MARTTFVTGDVITASVINDFLQRSTGDSMLSDLAMSTYKITGLADGSTSTDAATKGQLDSAARAVRLRTVFI